MKDIKKYISDLDWNNAKDIQEEAIQQLFKIDEDQIKLLAERSELCNKSCWYNAALVLKKLGYPRNRLAIPYLMDWFKDINWPGVLTIVQLLQQIDLEVLSPYIKSAMEEALKEGDDLWASGLIYLIEQLNTSEFCRKEENLIAKLQKLADI